jgi:hypothetical protein
MMMRLVVFLIGLALVGFTVKTMLESKTGGEASADGRSAPKQQLDRVRDRAREIEVEQQRQADALLQKAGGGETGADAKEPGGPK